MLNPYSHSSFFQFFSIFIGRLLGGFKGALFADEIQLAVLACVAASGALVGTFLLLRRQVMVANALSHTLLLGIVLAYLSLRTLSGGLPDLLSLKTLFIAGTFSAIGTFLLTEFLTRVLKVQEDASIGLVFSGLFALGIVLVTVYTRNTHIGIELVMGNVDALVINDLRIVSIVLIFNLILFCLFFKEFKLTTFDGNLASTLGFSLFWFNILILLSTSLTCVASFRAVGMVMVLAFFVIPPLAARLYTHKLKLLIVIAMLWGCGVALVSVAFSRSYLTLRGVGISTGGIVITALFLSYLLSLFVAPYSLLRHRLFKLKIEMKI